MIKKRVPSNYAISRKQRRAIAKRLMEKNGIKRACHHDYNTIGKGSFVAIVRIESYFSQHWRDSEYQEVF